jgi:nucleoside-triphosphatase
VLILTGSPGVGKTTVLMKTVEALKERGYSVGGMVSREVREGGVRVGFEIVDVNSSRRGWLAHVNQKAGPQVGKYRVNIRDLEDIGASTIVDAVESCDIVAIDEIGPMELFSGKFKEAARKALESRKVVLVVVHWKAQDRLILAAKNREDTESVIVTVENRERLPEVLAEKVVEYLKHI